MDDTSGGMDEFIAQPLCPSCRQPIEPKAVLCIACGYHFGLGRKLDTVVERANVAPNSTNPYASPEVEADPGRLGAGQSPEFDLTESAARQAKAVVDDADMVFMVILLSLCCCGIAWFVMLPWYVYRLVIWHRLFNEYQELRYPNAFSPHAAITAKFPDARLRLVIGVAIGAIFWVLLAVFAFGRL